MEKDEDRNGTPEDKDSEKTHTSLRRPTGPTILTIAVSLMTNNSQIKGLE